MTSKVFFIRVTNTENTETIQQKISILFEKADLGTCIGPKDLTAVKIHFGEKGNETHLPPEWARPVIDKIKKRGAQPFLTDTCVLYKSERNNAVAHLRLAQDHGFTIQNVGAPVIIADGLMGNNERDVAIPGRIFETVSVASIALEANAIIALSHVTGHLSTGIGATIKNLGMGFASRKGKLRQHSAMKPAISEKACTGCEMCVRWCPEDAISMAGNVARIDSESCIGCGECLTVCRFDAVKYDWKIKEFDLQQRMAEHALGAVINKKGKAGFINFLMSVTKDCDCFGVKQTCIIDDIGILAGKDPVAVDAAALDLIEKMCGRTLTDLSYPGLDARIQIRHGVSIGLGNDHYTLEEIR